MDQKIREKERDIESFNHDMKNKGKRHQAFDIGKLVCILKFNFESDHNKEDELYSEWNSNSKTN